MEIVLEVSQKKKQKQKQKLKIELLCDSTIPLFSIHPKELKPGRHLDLLFIAAQFTIAKILNKLTCPTMDE
jgi:hypothetical protein